MTSGRLLIALDLDGTVVRSDGSVSPRVRSAIGAVRDAGHHVVLATGRAPQGAFPVIETLGLGGAPAVCSNGAVTLQAPGTILAEHTFCPEPLLTAVARYLPGCAVAVEPAGLQGFRATAAFPSDELPGDVLVIPWEQFGALQVRRVIVDPGEPAGPADRADPAHRSDPAHRERLTILASDLGLTSTAATTGDVRALEIGPPGVSKASALEALRTVLGVSAGWTIAVGDHLNDLEMLRWAARGVAMGHAPSQVLASATDVTGSCADDGLADVLEPLARRECRA